MEANRATIAGGLFAALLVLVAAAAGYRIFDEAIDGAAATSPAVTPSTMPATAVESQGFLYGRVTTVEGMSHEGRLRWGGDEEAFWGDYFSGAKRDNPWIALVPPELLPRETGGLQIFGFKLGGKESPVDVKRRFMARFGELARIEALSFKVLRVTLKSGSAFELDRLDASDLDDGLRVWDRGRALDLDSLQIRSIELLPTPPLATAEERIHGTVQTRQGDFTGFVQWDREEGVGSDALEGRSAEGKLSLRYDSIRSIARQPSDSDNALVTLRDGREIVLSKANQVGDNDRVIYVDDRRYGRVQISWDVFEHLDFSPGGSGPAYDDFAPGSPLTGSVTTRAGERRAGRLVYDLDESETTDTLDAPSQGLDYNIPFGLIASIVPEHATVTLHDGEALRLEHDGDLATANLGVLVFVDGAPRPEYLPWSEVERIDLDRPR